MQLAGVGVIIAVMPQYWEVYSRQVMIHISVGIALEILAGGQVSISLELHILHESASARANTDGDLKESQHAVLGQWYGSKQPTSAYCLDLTKQLAHASF